MAFDNLAFDLASRASVFHGFLARALAITSLPLPYRRRIRRAECSTSVPDRASHALFAHGFLARPASVRLFLFFN